MGLLAGGNAMLNRHLHGDGSTGGGDAVAVEYRRGAESLALADAVVGRTAFVSNQQGAARVERSDRDYLIPAASLGAFGEPQVGDRITETVGGEVRVYECRPPRTGEKPARFSDPTETVWRVHCRRVGA